MDGWLLSQAVAILHLLMEETVEFEDVSSTNDTPLALKCLIEGKPTWIPKSQIHEDSEVYRRNQQGKLIISRWIAEQKGLV